ncbi:RyR domain-containing protein [Hyphomonas sp.]|uniref:RyR domain-containing protein n=1 Tax=Hyphomonas sp. TaxID=87 RepID=UPI00391A5399
MTQIVSRDDRIARVVHEALRAWSAANGQHDIPAWEEAPDWMQASTCESVHHALTHPEESGEAQHAQWLRQKEAGGWRYGPVKDAAAKTHPLMVPWNALPDVERRKDVLLQAVVRALA